VTRNPSVTEITETPDRGQALTIDSGVSMDEALYESECDVGDLAPASVTTLRKPTKRLVPDHVPGDDGRFSLQSRRRFRSAKYQLPSILAKESR
jgi:hypothetical protein